MKTILIKLFSHQNKINIIFTLYKWRRNIKTNLMLFWLLMILLEHK